MSSAPAAVVVQDQSLRPLNDPAGHARDFARIAAAVRAHAAAPMLFVTWARRDVPGMQARLDAASGSAAAAARATTIDVGAAWKRARERHPHIALHDSDGSHPTMAGSYLAACVVFRTIHRRSPVGLDPLTLEPQVATRLQAAADD